MKTSRPVALSVILILLAADVAGAMYLREAWQARHGESSTRAAQSGVEHDGAAGQPGGVRHGSSASL